MNVEGDTRAEKRVGNAHNYVVVTVRNNVLVTMVRTIILVCHYNIHTTLTLLL